MRKAIIALILVGLLALITVVPVFAGPLEPQEGLICHADSHSDGRASEGISHNLDLFGCTILEN